MQQSRSCHMIDIEGETVVDGYIRKHRIVLHPYMMSVIQSVENSHLRCYGRVTSHCRSTYKDLISYLFR